MPARALRGICVSLFLTLAAASPAIAASPGGTLAGAPTAPTVPTSGDAPAGTTTDPATTITSSATTPTSATTPSYDPTSASSTSNAGASTQAMGSSFAVMGSSAPVESAIPAPKNAKALLKNPTGATGGSAYSSGTTLPHWVVPGSKAKIIDGLAAAPAQAPPAVQDAIWAANALIGKPYIYAGGHASWIAPGYDCSGTVSFALHGGFMLSSPLDSSQFENWGASGPGHWITLYTDPAHVYMTIAGLRLDTSAVDDPTDQQGPRWRPLRSSNSGYMVRHPNGL